MLERLSFDLYSNEELFREIMTDKEKDRDANNTTDPIEPVEAEIVDLEPEVEAESYEGEETQDEVEALLQDLAQARAEANEYLDGWQRSRAEFANYKKRVDRELAQANMTATGNIIKRYLNVLDDLERALKNRPQNGEGAVWANGIELIYRKFLSILENEGVKAMEAEGQVFDPNLHEALSSEESDEHDSGEIIEVVQQGYMLDDRVLRPALVRVAR
jgi:molecular chaperone GrpE